MRGPGAKALKRQGVNQTADLIAPHAWENVALPLWQRVLLFCESLPVTAGPLAGSLWRARTWQKKFIKAVFKTDRRGRRVVRTAVLSVGRKNGKSDLATRLCLAFLVGPCSEPRGECYSAANDRAQAGRLFAEMCAIIASVPWLAARISIRRHSKELEDCGPGGNGSTYAALSSDVAVAHGKSVSFFCYDEYGQSTNSHLWDALDTGMGGRDQPLGICISTQAANDSAPLSKLIDYGQRVNRGEVKDSSFHLTLYAAPADADPFDPATWKLANPALNDFRSLSDVERMAAQAQRMPSKEASFRNLILNQRIDSTAQFLTAAVWNGCCQPVDIDRLKGRPCYAALDLSGSRDLTALVLAFPDDDDMVDIVPFAWLPADDLREREDEDRAPYSLWRDQGHLLTCPGKTIDPKTIALKIAELHGEYNFVALGYDRWRIEDLKRELDAIGCDVPLTALGQGYRDMSPALDELERLAFEGKLRGGSHPVLTMCISNLKAETDPAGNRKPSKSRSSGRIDLAAATAMVLGLIKRASIEEPSVYSGRGLLAL